jgi:hypothetical protein
MTVPNTTSMSGAGRLAQDAAAAAAVRSYQTHPDVVALRIERIRTQVDRLCWVGIILGLAFTMTNVAVFAAGNAAAWSLPWLAAWVLDPTVSLVLLAVLRAEQVTSRYQVRTGPWVRTAKWFTLAATYVMNTWASWAAGSTAGVVLHSVPPLLVFVATEAVTDLRDKLTDAVAVNGSHTSEPASTGPVNAFSVFTDIEADEDASTDPKDVIEAPSPQRSGRGTFVGYREVARRAWSPEVTITPAWVREVTGCSRGLSSRLAAALRTELGAGPDVTSDRQPGAGMHS